MKSTKRKRSGESNPAALYDVLCQQPMHLYLRKIISADKIKRKVNENLREVYRISMRIRLFCLIRICELLLIYIRSPSFSVFLA
jgi:hypothetical protein